MEYSFNDRKTEIKKTVIDLLCCAALSFVLTIIVIIIAFVFVESERHRLLILCGSIPILILVFIAFLTGAVYVFCIYIKIKNVNTNHTEKLIIKCKKIRFISCPVGRAMWKILCAVLIDDRGQKYIAFFSCDLKAEEKKVIKANLTRGIEILKYTNSNVVVNIDNLL